jgi:PAS domain S-box-containing protein
METLDTIDARYEALQEQFKVIFDQSPVSITIMGVNGKVVDCNPATEDLIGYSKTEIVGKAFTELVTMAEEDLPGLMKQYEMLLHNQIPNPMDIQIRRKNGEPRWISVLSSILRGERKVTGFLVMVNDITDRKMAEEQLKQANKGLKELDRLKEEFYADIAHEYRTPLIAIRGFVELLLSSPSLTAEQKGDLEIVLRNENRLEELINNMLEYSRLKSGHIAFKKDIFRVSEICTEMRKELFPLIVEKHLEIVETIQPDEEVVLDRHYITSVIRNLLTNALKFSFPNGQIIIHSSILDGVWTFSIRDFGIGISKEDIPKMFNRFMKLKASDLMNPNGIGIGLTICQNIINAYGGKVWGASEGLNTGATFTFQLKLAD